MSDAQILTVAQVQAAEQAIFDTGVSVSQLMEIAAGGAAEWIRRVAAGRAITVLCGPGNNGGDGYVIARRMREFGNEVRVIAPMNPATDAARTACEAWNGPVSTSGNGTSGGVFVDCLFGSGLSRALSGELALLLRDLAERHGLRIAVDLPSGIESDSGATLNSKLPQYDVTLALGAWKFAHWLLPARALMGRLRLVPIGIDAQAEAAHLVTRPGLSAPAREAHKYARGLVAVIGGDMPGAALLAAEAARRAGAGYVKLMADRSHPAAAAGLVIDESPLTEALADSRINALLVGPGLGRGTAARERLTQATQGDIPLVLDADALVLLERDQIAHDRPILATPHDGELESLCKTFDCIAEGRKARAVALARTSGMVVCAKGPDTFIAAPDGRIAIALPAPSWLSVAGTGDVLAGIAVSRMAAGRGAFEAACEAVWLHIAAARQSAVPFTPDILARNVAAAYRACL